MTNYQVRTDLALEARESIPETEEGMLRGIRVEEEERESGEIHVTRVMIETKNAAKVMGKPMGTYITVESPALVEPDEDFHREISRCLAE